MCTLFSASHPNIDTDAPVQSHINSCGYASVIFCSCCNCCCCVFFVSKIAHHVIFLVHQSQSCRRIAIWSAAWMFLLRSRRPCLPVPMLQQLPPAVRHRQPAVDVPRPRDASQSGAATITIGRPDFWPWSWFCILGPRFEVIGPGFLVFWFLVWKDDIDYQISKTNPGCTRCHSHASHTCKQTAGSVHPRCTCLPVSRPLNPLTSAARENTFDQFLRSGKGMVILNEQSSVLQFSESPALFSQRSLVLGPWSSLVRVLGLHRVHVPCGIYHPSPWQVLAIYSFCRQEVYWLGSGPVHVCSCFLSTTQHLLYSCSKLWRLWGYGFWSLVLGLWSLVFGVWSSVTCRYSI